jgi:hypothetical protein
VATRKSNAELKKVVVAENKKKKKEKASEKRAATQARHDQLTLLINGPMPHDSQKEDLVPLEDI